MKTRIRATVTLNAFESGVICDAVKTMLDKDSGIKPTVAAARVPLTPADKAVLQEFIEAHEKVISPTFR